MRKILEKSESKASIDKRSVFSSIDSSGNEQSSSIEKIKEIEQLVATLAEDLDDGEVTEYGNVFDKEGVISYGDKKSVNELTTI